MSRDSSPVEPPPDPTSAVADPARLRAVRDTGLLDTPPEEVFDRMTRLASRIIGAPASFISLVDADRDFYKSAAGFPEPLATARQLEGRTFCHYSLLLEQPLVLGDVTALPGYRDVPTVKSLGVRAYLGVPLRTPDGQAIGSFCAIDVEPRVWSEQDVETLTELACSVMREINLRAAVRDAETRAVALRAADRRKDVFVATMAHELRQPLAAIVPALALMRARISQETGVRAREVIDRQVTQIQRLVDDLMDVASIAEGKVELKLARTDLCQVAEDAVRGVRTLLDQRGVIFRLALPARPAWIVGDSGRLQQVFSNLLTNAIKYTPAKERIDLEVALHDSTARVTVRDSGRGIAPEALPYIFELFMQESRDQRAGLGIGLKVVRGLVELHGGTVEARSGGSGLGSEFVVTLPREGGPHVDR